MADQVPSGLQAFSQNRKFAVKIQGGLNDWMEYPSVKKFTNAFIIDKKNNKVRRPPLYSGLFLTCDYWLQILLGYKKRGFAQGVSACRLTPTKIFQRWLACSYNGFGGKVDQEETSLEAANRELKVIS